MICRAPNYLILVPKVQLFLPKSKVHNIKAEAPKKNTQQDAIYVLQGEFEFSEDPPGKRVFDIQIKELRAKAAFPCP